ncbi:hypothetical protein [Devosia ginsengisoli]|nr:hypothetical protein [Devosia ginsengisoli]
MKTFRAFAVAALLGATILAPTVANAKDDRSPIGDLFCWIFPEICGPLDL